MATGIKKSKLAELSDLFPSQISDYEKGTKEPNIHSLVKISEALNVSPSVLLSSSVELDDIKERYMQNAFDKLNETEQDKTIEYMDFLLSLRR